MIPKITVVMAVYNGEKYVNAAIKSILNQSYANFEFIIIDDASTDGTSAILKHHKNMDSRITIFKNDKNIGLTKSLNRGIVACSSVIIARQDADDISHRERLGTQLAVLENQKLDLVGCKHLPDPSKILHGTVFSHGSFMFRKRLGLYDESFKYCQDYEFILRAYMNSYKIGGVSEHLYKTIMVKNRISDTKTIQQSLYRTMAKLKNTDMSGSELLIDLIKYLAYRLLKRIKS